MSERSKIGWTDDTWNPWIGCTKVSPGCKNCYAETLDNMRFSMTLGQGSKEHPISHWGKGSPRHRTATLKDPLKWNKKPWVCDQCGTAFAEQQAGHCGAGGKKCYPVDDFPITYHRRRVFSLSLGDWLDEEVPIEWLADMLNVIRQCPGLDFLLLTKRPENFREAILGARNISGTPRDLIFWLDDWYSGNSPDNVWIGVSVENQRMADERIPLLLDLPATVKFLSVEPLLEYVDITRQTNPNCFDWVIVGGESGTGRRDCGVEAIVNVVEQCQSAGTPVFVKQDCHWKDGQQGRIPDQLWTLKQFPKTN